MVGLYTFTPVPIVPTRDGARSAGTRVWTTIIVSAFCRTALGCTPARARMLTVAHQGDDVDGVLRLRLPRLKDSGLRILALSAHEQCGASSRSVGWQLVWHSVPSLTRCPHETPITIEGYQILSGDFHCHAFVGDGGIAPWMLQRHATHVGLDVIAITNHNQTLAGRLGRAAAQPSGPLVLVGEEITGRDYHLIGVGIERPVNWDQPARGAIADVHAQGGVAIAAHPMHGFDGYDPVALADLDGVEVAYRDSLSSTMALQFVEFYQRTLAQNQAVAAIGSSDFHTSGPMGLCRTYLFVRERSEAGVIQANPRRA
jgi:predicted metal-dependent phosphoesterase TrpH